MTIEETARRQLEVTGRPQATEPDRPEGLLARVLYPFRRGQRPEVQPTVGFFTDTSVCIGCKACQVACKEWNLLPAASPSLSGQSYDNTLTLSAEEWRHVKFVELFEKLPLPEPPLKPTADFSDEELQRLLAEPKVGRWLMMSDSCKHCEAAPCHQACPTGAIIHTEFGSVFIQPDICNGCASCVAACPFGVVTRSEVDGHSYKCTLCYDRLRDGLEPACARACPTWSISFGPLDEMKHLAEERLRTLRGEGLAQARLYGAEPCGSYSALRNIYLLLDEPGVYGLPDPPMNPHDRQTGDYLRAGVGLLTALALLAATMLWGG